MFTPIVTRFLRGRSPLALGLALCLASLAGAVSVRALASRFTGPAPPAPAPPTAVQADGEGPTPSGGPPVVYIYLTASGFENDQFTFPAGPRHVVVKNISTFDRLDFTLKRKDGLVILEGGLDNGAVKHGVLSLDAGEYFLTEASHPDWLCHITIVS